MAGSRAGCTPPKTGRTYACGMRHRASWNTFIEVQGIVTPMVAFAQRWYLNVTMQGAAKYHQWMLARGQTSFPKDDPDVRMLFQGIKEVALVAQAKAATKGKHFHLTIVTGGRNSYSILGLSLCCMHAFLPPSLVFYFLCVVLLVPVWPNRPNTEKRDFSLPLPFSLSSLCSRLALFSFARSY